MTARKPNEDFESYRQRRAEQNADFRRRFEPRLVVKSCDLMVFPKEGKDPALDADIRKQVEQGNIRGLQRLVRADGTETRVARTKGEPYRRYPADGRRRREHRA